MNIDQIFDSYWSYPDDVNRTGSAIERDRTVEIRLSNGQILGNYSIGLIEIRLRSIAFGLGSIMFDWDSIVLDLDSILFDIHLIDTREEWTQHGCGESSLEVTY